MCSNVVYVTFLLCICVYLYESVAFVSYKKLECCSHIWFESTSIPGQKSFIPGPGLDETCELKNTTVTVLTKCVSFYTQALHSNSIRIKPNKKLTKQRIQK